MDEELPVPRKETPFDSRMFAWWVGATAAAPFLSTLLNANFRVALIGSVAILGELPLHTAVLVTGAGPVITGLLMGGFQYAVLARVWPISKRFVWKTLLGVLIGGFVGFVISGLLGLVPSLLKEPPKFIEYGFWFVEGVAAFAAAWVLALIQWSELKGWLTNRRTWLLGVALGAFAGTVLSISIFRSLLLFFGEDLALNEPIADWAKVLISGIFSGLAIHRLSRPNDGLLAPVQREGSVFLFTAIAGTLAFALAIEIGGIGLVTRLSSIPAAIELNYDSPIPVDGKTQVIFSARALTEAGEPVQGVRLRFNIAGNVDPLPVEIIGIDSDGTWLPVRPVPSGDAILEAGRSSGCFVGTVATFRYYRAEKIPGCWDWVWATTGKDGIASVRFLVPSIDQIDDRVSYDLLVNTGWISPDIENLFATAEIFFVAPP